MERSGYMGRVRGLGSSREATSHWWAQRLTSVALLPLVLWFAYSAIGFVDADHLTVLAWLGDHVNAVLMILLVVTLFYHADLGLKVIIEDYVHREGLKIVLIFALHGAAIVLATTSVIAVVRLMLWG